MNRCVPPVWFDVMTLTPRSSRRGRLPWLTVGTLAVLGCGWPLPLAAQPPASQVRNSSATVHSQMPPTKAMPEERAPVQVQLRTLDLTALDASAFGDWEPNARVSSLATPRRKR